MNENTSKVTIAESHRSTKDLCQCVHTVANVLQVHSADDDVVRFGAKTIATNALVLITVKKTDESSAKMTVNCEKMVIGTMLLKDIKAALEK